jgi:hypothetical protein
MDKESELIFEAYAYSKWHDVDQSLVEDIEAIIAERMRSRTPGLARLEDVVVDIGEEIYDKFYQPRLALDDNEVLRDSLMKAINVATEVYNDEIAAEGEEIDPSGIIDIVFTSPYLADYPDPTGQDE